MAPLTVQLPDGRTLGARRWSGVGEPVVLLHGLLDSSESWAALEDHLLAPRIAFDLPGFGRSEPPPRGSLESYAADVMEGLDAMGVDRFTLVGHSLGGAVATALAELIPERVTSLILLAPVGFGRMHMAEALLAPLVRGLVGGVMPYALSSRMAVSAGYLLFVANGRPPDAAVVDRLTSGGRSQVVGVLEAMRAFIEAGRQTDGFGRRRIDYDGPVTAIWGDRDRLVPLSHRHGVMEAFPHATVEVWRKMGHHPLRERFADLLAVIEGAVGPRVEPALALAG